MNKRTLTVFLLLLCLVLAACSPAEDPQRDGSPEDSSMDDQIEVMVANKDLWLEPAEEYATFYAVTDLNDNGRLELMRAASLGEWWTETAFFEISEDKQSLEQLAFPYGEEHSHPDLVDLYDAQLFAGPDGRYLIATDDIWMGPVQAANFQNYHVLDYVKIGEGVAEVEDIAWAMVTEEDTNYDGVPEDHILYYDLENTKDLRDADWYVASPSEYFEGYEQLVCSLSWWTPDTFVTPDDYTDEAVREGLQFSWDGYSVREDAEVFAGLIEDPATRFYAGATLYGQDDEVPYFPSFMDIRGDWYIQHAWTDEVLWFLGDGLGACELNILDNGDLYGNYFCEYDPRGAYLFTEMKMVSDSKADGTDKDDWVIVYESEDGQHQMQLRPDPDNMALYVTWYEWPEGDHSIEPTVLNLVYSRIAG